MDSAWDREDYISDGVDLTIKRIDADGTHRELFHTYLNPREVKRDRGNQEWEIEFDLPAFSTVLVEVGPGPHRNGSTDWFYFRSIRFD